MTTGVTSVTTTTANPTNPIKKNKNFAKGVAQEFQNNPAKAAGNAAAAAAFMPLGVTLAPGMLIGTLLGGIASSYIQGPEQKAAAAAGNAAKGAIKAGQIGAEAVKKVSGTKKPQGDAQNEDNKHHFDRKA